MWFTDAEGNREFLHPLSVEGICIEGIRDYQFVQKSDDTFDILLEVEEKADSHILFSKLDSLMKSILEKKKLGFVHYEIRKVPHIKPDPETGKKALIKKINLKRLDGEQLVFHVNWERSADWSDLRRSGRSNRSFDYS